MTDSQFAPPSPLIEVQNLCVDYKIRSGGLHKSIRAVDCFSMRIARGEIVALVGESGCGKSTTGRALARLVRPSNGAILFSGIDISHLPERRLRVHRSKIQMVFQHPGPALNPRVLIWRSIAEPLEAIGVKSEDCRLRVDAILQKVGLPAQAGQRYSHELSGGQLQRVAIARALVGRPDFVVADEPLSSLDLSVQAQIMVLLKELQEEFGTSLLFITHDLAAAEYLSNRIAVMYLSKLVECAPAQEFSRRALHPYSKALLDSIPLMDPGLERNRHVEPLPGEVPSPLNPPTGCRFHTRCPLADERCRREEPMMRKVSDEHEIACWRV